MPNTPPMNVSLSKLRLFERDYTHPIIVLMNGGLPSPVKCYIQLRSVSSIPPPLTLHRGKNQHIRQ
eukprot:scaffold249377_cov70-Cyclotella_meneghiniana.AAC.1